jgi:plasmid stability protein
VSTDHCAFRFSDQKTLGANDFSKIPNGGSGIENCLILLYTSGVASGLMDLNRLVRLAWPKESTWINVMLDSSYKDYMANLQVKNIPDDLHERLRRHARENHRTISAAVLAAIERELARWEWRQRLDQRPKTDLGIEVAALLTEERALRDMETG